jgi:hypothetical protein
MNNLFRVDAFVLLEDVIELQSFRHGYPVVPELFGEKIILL